MSCPSQYEHGVLLFSDHSCLKQHAQPHGTEERHGVEIDHQTARSPAERAEDVLFEEMGGREVNGAGHSDCGGVGIVRVQLRPELQRILRVEKCHADTP